MRWSFTLQGSPPSVNNSYKPTIRSGIDRRGRPFEGLAIEKRRSAKLWQAQMIPVVRSARPPHWKPEREWIRIEVRAYLGQRMDMDNMLKNLHDVIQEAIGINDKWFLPCFPDPPVLGLPEKERRLEVTIDG